MSIWIKFALGALAVYAAVGLAAYLGQRKLMYFPDLERTLPAEVGLTGVVERVIETPDGERVIAWYAKARPSRPTLLYFHGNGGSLLNRRDPAKLLTEGGRGLLLSSYRGYSGSTGKPGEAGLRTDARTAYEWLRARVPADSIVLYGESLGSGVAVGLATERPVGGLILDAPFTSTADVAGHHYWYLPVWLLRDQYRSIDRIHELRCPLLVIHGDRDGVIPIALGERLFAAAPEPKRFVTLPGVDHVSVLERGGLEPVRAFLDSIEKRPS
jgi:fermentation-respiration switch protein FrsA (DUF1100 family)